MTEMKTDEHRYPEWNTTEWLGKFNSAMHPVNHHALKQLRQMVYYNTLNIVRAGGYRTEDGTVVSLPLDDEIIKNTRFYHREIPQKEPSTRFAMEISVVQQDSLSCARQLLQQGEREVCVLNMASRSNPGGGALVGSGAQEEYLFRCSNYFRSLYQYVDFADLYDIPRSKYSYPLDRNFGGIFTPNATVFRDLESKGYKLLNEPFKVNFIAAAAISHPKVVNDRIADELLFCVRKKMHTLFRIALDNQQEVLVLGAWGCGAFANPPQHVAELFQETLQEEEFKGAFRKVLFAIKGGPRAGNYQPFKDVLNPDVN